MGGDVLSERTALRAGTAAAPIAVRSGNGRSFYRGTDGSNLVPSARTSHWFYRVHALDLGAGLRSCFRVGDRRSRAGAAVVLTPKWDQRFESGFLQRRVSDAEL